MLYILFSIPLTSFIICFIGSRAERCESHLPGFDSRDVTMTYPCDTCFLIFKMRATNEDYYEE